MLRIWSFSITVWTLMPLSNQLGGLWAHLRRQRATIWRSLADFGGSWDTPCLVSFGSYRSHLGAAWLDFGALWMPKPKRDPECNFADSARWQNLIFLRFLRAGGAQDIPRWPQNGLLEALEARPADQVTFANLIRSS